jgi:hypothetical protein
MARTRPILGRAGSHLYESGAIFDVRQGCKVEFEIAGLWGKETQN